MSSRLSKVRAKVLLPTFLGPRTRKIGGSEVSELEATAASNAIFQEDGSVNGSTSTVLRDTYS
jgi:hypothetical protein